MKIFKPYFVKLPASSVVYENRFYSRILVFQAIACIYNQHTYPWVDFVDKVRIKDYLM